MTRANITFVAEQLELILNAMSTAKAGKSGKAQNMTPSSKATVSFGAPSDSQPMLTLAPRRLSLSLSTCRSLSRRRVLLSQLRS